MTIRQRAEDLTASKEITAEIDCSYDTVVVGGGMSGCAAAMAAASSGASVLLIEQNAFLGGAATAGMVGQFVGWKTRSGRQVVKGLAQDIVDRLHAEGGCGPIEDFTMSTGHRMNRVQYDAELLKLVLDDCVAGFGADVLFKATLVATEKRDNGIACLYVWCSGKILVVRAASFVDASGDMGLLTSAGAALIELEEGERLQPATMMFSVGPVDFDMLDALSDTERKAIIEKGLAEGALPRAALHYNRAPGTNTAWFNISRVSVDPDDPFSLSEGEQEGRRQAVRIARFLTANLPGCTNARLAALAPQLGIRDTRRIRGDYVVTADDIRSGVDYADTIACGAYPIDIHHPERTDITFLEFGEDHFYRIPLRALVPIGLDNVVAAGRGISATHEAFAALRVMPTAMAIGHAAGLAAGQASLKNQGAMRAVDVQELRSTLGAQGAYLGG